jgi:hypothetical protein
MSLQRAKQMVRGAGRLFDFSGSYARSGNDYAAIRSRLEEINRTDREKLASDWQKVGRDMWKTVHQHQE